MPYEDWDARLRNHLYGPFYCCQQFVRARRAGGGGGHIVNVGALHRVLPRAGTGAYDAADGGLRHLVRSLALELAPDGIGVNHVAPGEGLSAMKRVAQPQDIARLVLFLVSDEGAYANGQAYAIV
jgi:glucose 1-dehydrogenase